MTPKPGFVFEDIADLYDRVRPSYALPVWAGVLPLPMTIGTPISDVRLNPGTEIPGYMKTYKR